MGVAMFEQLRSELEEAAFLVVKDADEKVIHSKIVKCLVILSQIENGESTEHRTPEEVEVSEINKVSRRLKMWAKRQNQYNSKILNAFLALRREGKTKISEADLEGKLGPNTWFSANYSQMKSFADKNHGKVFQQSGEFIEIWRPISQAVNEYESKVFKNA